MKKKEGEMMKLDQCHITAKYLVPENTQCFSNANQNVHHIYQDLCIVWLILIRIYFSKKFQPRKNLCTLPCHPKSTWKTFLLLDDNHFIVWRSNHENVIRTMGIIDELDLAAWKDLGMLCESDTFLSADDLSKFGKFSLWTYCLDRLYCVFSPVYIYHCNSNEIQQEVEYILYQKLSLSVESALWGRISSVHGRRFFKRVKKGKCNTVLRIIYMDYLCRKLYHMPTFDLIKIHLRKLYSQQNMMLTLVLL